MKIVKILGGIGNQMFQYAFLMALKSRFNDIFLVDISIFDIWNIHNGYELERVFNIKEKKASVDEIKNVAWYSNNYKVRRALSLILPKKTMYVEKSPYKYYPQFVNKDGDAYYDGYWQYYKYFEPVRKDVLYAFQFVPDNDERNNSLISKMNNENYVSIHVRRGDYLESKEYKGICGIDYYKKAIDLVRSNISNPTYLIFSNDIEWCKINITPLLENSSVTFVDWNVGANSFRDMELMSKCRANIIANSSFSWWAAYLNSNEHKFVVSPKKWTNRKMEFNVQPDDWNLI